MFASYEDLRQLATSGNRVGPKSLPAQLSADRPAITLNATDNFWGSSGGPSASGPGDAAGGACDQNNATTTARPFAAAVL
jgi:hypothetical protein